MEENKNFEELEEEVKKELDEVEAVAEESEEETREQVKDVLNTVKGALGKFKEAILSIDINKDGVTVGNHVEELTKTVGETIGKANEKFAEIKDEKGTEAWEKVKVSLGKVTDTVVTRTKEAFGKVTEGEPAVEETVDETVDQTAEKVDKVVDDLKAKGAELYEKAVSNEEVKKVVDKVSEKTKEVAGAASEKYQEFIHDEKVRETVRNAKNTVTDFADKLADAVKGILGKKEE